LAIDSYAVEVKRAGNRLEQGSVTVKSCRLPPGIFDVLADRQWETSLRTKFGKSADEQPGRRDIPDAMV
jgi:hypothetical protein